MPDLTADEVILTRHKRLFLQFGGAKLGNPVQFAGLNTQYAALEGVSAPEVGNIDPQWVHDPRRVGFYRLVARTIAPADLPKATLRLREKHGVIPIQLFRVGCALNVYEVTGTCEDLSDFVSGWSDYVMVYSNGLITDKDLGNRSSFDADEIVEDGLSLTFGDIYPVGRLGFSEKAATAIDREVIDVAYGSIESCGDCTPTDDGTKRAYAVTGSSGGSPGLPNEIVYTVDGGATWNQVNLTLLANEYPLAIDVAGKYLIVVVYNSSTNVGCYYYAEINPFTGVPGAFTRVGTGFVGTNYPRDLYVFSPSEIYFCGNGGYIYKCTDVPSGVTVIDAGNATNQNLLRIHGSEQAIVCVGNGGAIVKSVNRGQSFVSVTTTPSASPFTAVAVRSKTLYWVASAARVWNTQNGGETWEESIFPGSGSGQVKDIVFATDEVGYISHSTTTPTARILATWNGGVNWTLGSPRIENLPVFNYANRLDVPKVSSGIAANTLLVGGIAGGGVDGILLLAISGKH